MTRTFKSTLIAALTFAMASTSIAAPARADSDDVAKVIFGATALYMLSRVIKEHNGHTVHRPQVVHRNTHTPRHVAPRQQAPRNVIPAACYREIQRTNGTTARGYLKRCMENRARRAHLLPQHCLRRDQTVRGVRNFYRGKCLRRNGWVR